MIAFQILERYMEYEMIAEVYKEKGKEPWKYTRQVLASDGKIERLTTRYCSYDYAFQFAYDDFKAGKIHVLYLYYPWGTLNDVLRAGDNDA